jgi:hypothetical protein
MKEGTNADNFIVNRGGWNCGHQLIPVREEAVPKAIRNRVKAFKMTENSLSEMRKAGFDIDMGDARMTDAEFARLFNSGNMAGFNIPEFDKNLDATLKGYDANSQITSRKITMYNNGNVRLSYGGIIHDERFTLISPPSD